MRRLLPKVRHVRVSARDATGVRLRGEGDVVVSPEPDGSVLVSETGIWRDRGGAAVRFTNAYRWRFDGDSILIAHERRGQDQAVALVDLAPTGQSRWVSRAPHR